MSPRRSAEHAALTRQQIVRAGVERASRLGLEGLTIGDLASELDMSKSGVIGPFGSRNELLDTVLQEAVRIFRDSVVAPLSDHSGPERLDRLVDLWVGYLVYSPFSGGCFVSAASAELDDRPGPLRDQVVSLVRMWRSFLAAEITAARPDHSEDEIDVIVTTLVGISMAINQEAQLLADRDVEPRARTAMRRAIDSTS